jgi:uncharacterized protein
MASPPTPGVALPGRVIVTLRAGLFLALANVVCVVIFSWAWLQVKAPPKTLNVTGSAKKVIQSDLIVWTCRVSADDPVLTNAYEQLKGSVTKTRDYLTAHGIDAAAITVSSVSTSKRFQQDERGNFTDKVSGFDLGQTIEVTSKDVQAVAAVAREITDLIQEGVMLESNPPRYLYTGLADLKIEMLADATKDATTRARQIAENSGAKLGGLQEARMGVMQINPVHSTDVSDMGNSDTSSFEKEVMGVVSAKFSLE